MRDRLPLILCVLTLALPGHATFAAQERHPLAAQAKAKAGAKQPAPAARKAKPTARPKAAPKTAPKAKPKAKPKAAPAARSAAAAAAATPATPRSNGLKVGFIYPGEGREGGWSQAHEVGRRQMQAALGAQVQSTVIENVTTTDQTREAIRKLATSGHRLIFTTSFRHMNATEEMAEAYPRVLFENAHGYKKAANLGNYEGRVYEGLFLLGVAAARMSHSHVIGIVASYPVPETIRNINALTLGAQRVDPKVRVKVVWAQTWHDPARERRAAEQLVAAGADVIGQNTDSPAPMQVAQQRGKYGFSWDNDMGRIAPRLFLGAAVTDWGNYYTERVRAVLKGAWRPHEYREGLKEEMVKLTLGPAVPPAVAAEIEETRKAMRSYAIRVFAGPLRDQDGEVRVSLGANLRERELINVNWLVQGVDAAPLR